MFRMIVGLFCLLTQLSPAFAGPGHDHSGGHGEGSAPPSAGNPRIESTGSEFELVATAEGHKLTMYLDRPATNEPVDQATIEVSGEGIAPLQAIRTAPGTYVVEAEWLDMPGVKPLLFTVTAGDSADLLNGTLTIPDHTEALTAAPLPLLQVLARPDVVGVIAGMLVLGFVVALAFRSRRLKGENAAQPEFQPGAASHVSDKPLARSAARRDAAAALILSVVLSAHVASSAMAGPGHDHGDGGHDTGRVAASGNVPRKLADGSVFVPKPTQRLLQVRTQPAEETKAARTREFIGTVVSDPSAFGQVQSPMDGKIELSERGISFVGQNVEAGEVLALLTPTIPIADLGTMQQLRAEVEGKLIIAGQKLSRLTRIANVVAQRDIDDTKAELNALREQKRVLAAKDVDKFELKAPVSGIISLANVRAGQVVSARDTLFEIVDPNRLWVEGIGTDVHSDGDIASAFALDNEGHSFKLSYAGRSPALRQQSRPFLFRMDETHSGLAIGAPVKVFVQTKETASGFILPDAAVVRGGNSLAQVWVKVSPERFRPVPVRTIQIDGARTLAIAGLEKGDRIVIGGAELINQIR